MFNLKCALFIFLFANLTWAGPIYTIAPVLAPPGTEISNFSGLNNSGQITGVASTGGTAAQAFTGGTSSSTLVPLPSGYTHATGTALNDLGQVTGYVQGLEPTAFIGSTSGSSPIPLAPNDIFEIGLGVNNSGVVTGGGSGPVLNTTFLFDGSANSLVPPPPGWASASSSFGINGSGEIVGFGLNGLSVAQLFVSLGGVSTPVPDPSGFSTAYQGAINDSAEIAGIGNNSTTSQAFIGTTTGTTAIPLPAGATSVTPNGIVFFIGLNDLGVVIGNSDVGPWIWDSPDGTRLLDNLVPSGWTLSYVFGINNLGQIGAAASFDGSGEEAVILSPATTPEPASAELFGLALAFAIGLSRRIRPHAC